MPGERVIGPSADGGGVIVEDSLGVRRVVSGATPMMDVGGSGQSLDTSPQESPLQIVDMRDADVPTMTESEYAVMSQFIQPGAPVNIVPDRQRQPVALPEMIVPPSGAGARTAELIGNATQQMAPLGVRGEQMPAAPAPAGQVIGDARAMSQAGGGGFAVAPPAQAAAPAPAPAAPVAEQGAAPPPAEPQPDPLRTFRDVQRARVENVTRYGANTDDLREGIVDAAGNVAEHSEQEIAAYGHVADVLRDQGRLREEALQQRAEWAKRAEEGVETLLEAQRQVRIDTPERGVLGTIADVVSAALGGFAAGILGTENTALNVIRERIARQLETQRQNAELLQQDTENAVREVMRQAGVMATEDDLRNAAYGVNLEAAATEVRAQAAGVDNEEARGRLLALAGNLDNEVVQIREGIYRNLEEGMRRDARAGSGRGGPRGAVPPVTMIDPVTGRQTEVTFTYGPGGMYRTAADAYRARREEANAAAGGVRTMSSVEREDAQAEQERTQRGAQQRSWFTPRHVERDPQAEADGLPTPPDTVLRELQRYDASYTATSAKVERLRSLLRNGANFTDPRTRAEVESAFNILKTEFGTALYRGALQRHEMEGLESIFSSPNDVTPAVLQTVMPRLNAVLDYGRDQLHAFAGTAGYRPRGSGTAVREARPAGEVVQEATAGGGRRLPPGVRPVRR